MKIPFLSKKEPKKSSFSEFFRHASKEEKVRVFREVAREASEDQRKLLREYERKLGVTHVCSVTVSLCKKETPLSDEWFFCFKRVIRKKRVDLFLQ
jgi:hypothetical protein